ncbi:hypothetical protein DFH09DRAFT_1373408 [Mycena vulgaris]|nr:hypothetical protein DFH09DRAFT_1373408 [Mycena vulgaris]
MLVPVQRALTLMGLTRSILVTGSNQGLSMYTVQRLASTSNIAAAEESLAKFASDIHPSSTVVPVQLDITNASSIKAAHAAIVDHLKAKNLPGLDVLINNAAVYSLSFKDTYEVNVAGTAALTEAILPLINHGGAILDISSTIGSLAVLKTDPPYDYTPAYSSSKSALNSLTIQWAVQEQKKGTGIRVVSICPGYNATSLNNYTGTMSPADGCKIIVKAALETEGRTAVFIGQQGDVEW